MIDFDKMTVAEHEEYKEMKRKAEAWDKLKGYISYRCDIADKTYDVKSSDYEAGLSQVYGHISDVIEDYERTD